MLIRPGSGGDRTSLNHQLRPNLFVSFQYAVPDVHARDVEGTNFETCGRTVDLHDRFNTEPQLSPNLDVKLKYSCKRISRRTANTGGTRLKIDGRLYETVRAGRVTDKAPVALIIAAIDGTTVTWINASRIAAPIEYDFLLAPRGFAQALMDANMSQVIQALVTSN